MKKIKYFFISLLFFSVTFSQSYGSRDGYYLPVHGTIRVLVVFVEIHYTSGEDPTKGNEDSRWVGGQLPTWATELFDPMYTYPPRGLVTSFYHEASFGDFRVLGDVWINLLHPNAPFLVSSNGTIDPKKILEEMSNLPFSTYHSLPLDSFDLWDIKKGGKEKVRKKGEAFASFDHIMFIVRNATYPASGAGYASGWSMKGGKWQADSYSVFATSGANPLNILLHEFNHLLLGGNNMHCCGGNHASSGPQYFLSFQAGWGMMGAANRILMTANGWDRYKLGWKLPEKKYYISCLDIHGNEIKSDFSQLEQSRMDTTLILRDFASTGDVIRIRIPFIPSDEYPQWLWLENHQTKRFNGSRFDVFQYEDALCIEKAIQGVYAYLQVAHEDTLAPKAFEDYADFIRVFPASGFYDLIFEDTLVQNNWCLNNLKYYPFLRKPERMNPFSGNSVHELVAYDNDGDCRIREKEKRDLAIEKVDGIYRNNLPYLGEPKMAFLPGMHISISTNPAVVNTLTYLNDDRAINKGKKPDNRIIYLNGIKIEFLQGDPLYPGSIKVRIVSSVPEVDQSTRWAAPYIFLPKQANSSSYDLIIRKRVRLVIDRSFTPTADTMYSRGQWNPPTRFVISSKAKIYMEKGSRLILKNGSELILQEGAQLIREKGAKIKIRSGGHLIKNKGEIKLN